MSTEFQWYDAFEMNILLFHLSHKTDHQHIARMQSEIYLVDRFRPEKPVHQINFTLHSRNVLVICFMT
jgi:hypothetical protein